MSAFQPGELIGGRYRLLRMIGAGAMGTVWHARNESTDRDFALKLMLPDAAKNPVALQRFFQEAKASGRLRHRCIVEVYDLGRADEDGTPYLVMELLEGEPLDSLLKRKKVLPAGTALRIVRDLARALDVAHKQRIVHRDLKPANVYLHKTLEGTIVPKILDFGISKLVGPANFDPVSTSIGTVLGSPAYMSPEQAAGEVDVDGRSDVWSLGVILYKALCGAVPFSAPNYNALMMAISRNAHPPLAERVTGLPAEVSALVDRCLEKERGERLASAQALADAIDALLAKHPDLPGEALEAIVVAPVELPVDEARTIATMAERFQGTLAATEIDGKPAAGNTPTRQVPALADPTVPIPELQPPRRLRVIGSVAGGLLLLALAIVFTRGGGEESTPAVAAPAASSATPSETAPSAVVSAAPKPDEPAEAPSVAPFASAAPTTKPTKPTKHPSKSIVAKPKSTTKPVHEGVTAAGF